LTFYIHNKRVISARNRDEARLLFGLSHKQAANEMSVYDPSNDKDAIIPKELEKEIKVFKEISSGI
jgi:hypothetical protein